MLCLHHVIHVTYDIQYNVVIIRACILIPFLHNALRNVYVIFYWKGVHYMLRKRAYIVRTLR